MQIHVRRVFSLGILVAISLFLVSPIHLVYAQATVAGVTTAEATRDDQLSKELTLSMPDKTDDPSYPVTFVDPSKQGVEFKYDDVPSKKVTSPTLFPNLAIGYHTIVIKFTNKSGILRVLATRVLIIPKAPVFDLTLKTVVTPPEQMVLSGTALPQSTILIIQNSTNTYSVTSTQDGKWEFIMPNPVAGGNNIIAFTIRDGIASNPSKSVSISYQATQQAVKQTTTSSGFSFDQLGRTILANIEANRRDNPTAFYGILGTTAGLILLLIIFGAQKKASKKRDETTIAALFKTLQKDGGTIVDVIQESAEEQPVAKKTGKKKRKGLQKVQEEVVTLDADSKTSAGEAASLEGKPGKKVKKLKKKKAQKPEAEPEQKTESKKPLKLNFLSGLFAHKSQPQPEASTEVEPTEQKPQDKKEEPPKESEPDVKPEDEEITTEEPEKKVLSKEDFLKEFKKGAEQDE